MHDSAFDVLDFTLVSSDQGHPDPDEATGRWS